MIDIVIIADETRERPIDIDQSLKRIEQLGIERARERGIPCGVDILKDDGRFEIHAPPGAKPEAADLLESSSGRQAYPHSHGGGSLPAAAHL